MCTYPSFSAVIPRQNSPIFTMTRTTSAAWNDRFYDQSFTLFMIHFLRNNLNQTYTALSNSLLKKKSVYGSPSQCDHEHCRNRHRVVPTVGWWDTKVGFLPLSLGYFHWTTEDDRERKATLPPYLAMDQPHHPRQGSHRCEPKGRAASNQATGTTEKAKWGVDLIAGGHMTSMSSKWPVLRSTDSGYRLLIAPSGINFREHGPTRCSSSAWLHKRGLVILVY